MINLAVDWLLPGVPPTGHTVEIPTVAIVKFEGDKVAHDRKAKESPCDFLT
jgi:hypothetical protein